MNIDWGNAAAILMALGALLGVLLQFRKSRSEVKSIDADAVTKITAASATSADIYGGLINQLKTQLGARIEILDRELAKDQEMIAQLESRLQEEILNSRRQQAIIDQLLRHNADLERKNSEMEQKLEALARRVDLGVVTEKLEI